ncbi:hypothetical protein [uncultured Faecalibaculum sp.]|uniref:hypothetical protein n=1 Tax=uncultured Faecalibaculum sp. TaxID=1729681 RepID=UPI0025EB2A2B|nr:hypothetical protein [uncultured Faecalibaculum sp.]
MRKTLRICFLVLALLLTIFGWNESRAGVFLVWALLCVEEQVSLQMQENRSPVPWYHWYKPLLLAGAVVFVACALWLVFAG